MIRHTEPRSGRLERRLAELSRRRAELAAAEQEPESPSPYRPRARKRETGGRAFPILGSETRESWQAVPLEEIFAGGPIETPQGPIFLHERLRSEIETRKPGWGGLGPAGRRRRPRAPGWELAPGTETAPAGEEGDGEEAEAWSETLPLPVLHAELEGLERRGLSRILFLDLETCGLAQATIFLAGTMRWTGSDFVIHQFVARDYSEEAALLHAVAGEVAEVEGIVTFNGKAFDLPLLRDRATAARVRFPSPALHVDLLHHARARWRGQVPDCRLVTLEAWVCGRRRRGDVAGSEIPSVYHHFVRTGDAYRLVPVLHHNLLDVVTMEEILRALVN